MTRSSSRYFTTGEREEPVGYDDARPAAAMACWAVSQKSAWPSVRTLENGELRTNGSTIQPTRTRMLGGSCRGRVKEEPARLKIDVPDLVG